MIDKNNKKILYQTKTDKSPDGTIEITDYSLEKYFYHAENYNKIFLLNSYTNYLPITYKFKLEDNIVSILGSLEINDSSNELKVINSSSAINDLDRFFKETIIDYVDRDDCFNVNNDRNEYFAHIYDTIKAKLLDMNLLSDGLKLHGLGFVKYNNNVIATFDKMFIKELEEDKIGPNILLEDIVGNLKSFSYTDLAIEFHDSFCNKKIVISNFYDLIIETNNNLTLSEDLSANTINVLTLSKDSIINIIDDTDNIKYKTKKEYHSEEEYIQDRVKFFIEDNKKGYDINDDFIL